MRRRVLIAIVVVLALLTLAAQRVLLGLHGGDNPPITADAMAARFHRGEGPCVRYVDHRADPQVIRTTAVDLAAAGLTHQQVTDSFGRFLQLNQQAEEVAHAQAEIDEWWQVLTEHQDPLVKLGLGLGRRQFESVLTVPTAKVVADGTASFDALSARQQAELTLAFKAHREAFTVASVVAIVSSMKRPEAEKQVARVLSIIEQTGALPDSLDALSLTDEMMVDPWGTPLEFHKLDRSVSVTSLGADQVAGGDGDDADVVGSWPR